MPIGKNGLGRFALPCLIMKRLFCLKAKNDLGRFALSALPHYDTTGIPTVFFASFVGEGVRADSRANPTSGCARNLLQDRTVQQGICTLYDCCGRSVLTTGAERAGLWAINEKYNQVLQNIFFLHCLNYTCIPGNDTWYSSNSLSDEL